MDYICRSPFMASYGAGRVCDVDASQMRFADDHVCHHSRVTLEHSGVNTCHSGVTPESDAEMPVEWITIHFRAVRLCSNTNECTSLPSEPQLTHLALL